jgi:hypothetical protein
LGQLVTTSEAKQKMPVITYCLKVFM